ncbi:hypothetical protein J9B83_07265 [Marinomonas sp. A79]|uniref:Uncharacterized protein n=1 Tax=Marinomonas vulgaris TaxID=2823372 RepID=A0ABS5HAP9_9GAMM|nr:hypothetical protein [Marinomonas vulgaris]MBR7888741.1 hypothetical protein [Marinomonas vulgaris]
MTDTYLAEVNKLEKLRAAWLPAVEFLFGGAADQAKFDGFEVRDDISKPGAVFAHSDEPYRYTIQMPAKVFTNDVMMLADVMQELVRGQFPLGRDVSNTLVLCEGAAVFGAITAIKQVFGDEAVDSYLNALREQAFPYYDAFSYTAVLLAEDPQAIKKLREMKPFLYQVEKADFDAAGVAEIDRKIKDLLLLTFHA